MRMRIYGELVLTVSGFQGLRKFKQTDHEQWSFSRLANRTDLSDLTEIKSNF